LIQKAVMVFLEHRFFFFPSLSAMGIIRE